MSYNNNNNYRGRNNYGSPHQRGGFHPKSDPEEDFKNKLTSLIVRIGDKLSDSLASNIDGLANALLTDISNHNSTIQTILFKCISSLSYKTPIYGTLVGLMNVKNFQFGKEIVCTLIDEINNAFANKKFFSLKLLIRFIPELILANVLHTNAIFELYETLLSVLNTPDYTQNKADYYVYLVMSTIPWIGEHLSKNHLGQLNAVIDELESYVASRSHEDKKFYQPFTDFDDRLDLLMKQIRNLRDENGWVVNSILAPHKHFTEQLSVSTQHHILPPINLPINDSDYEYPSFNKPLFRLFIDEQKTIERYIIEDYIIDTLYFFNSNHKECSRFIYSLPVTFDIGDIVVETLLSEMFMLPKPTFKEIYYSLIFIDLFKSQPSIVPVFAYAINTLFESIDKLDIEIIDRFALTFAHHLSNFDYKWIWADWRTSLPTYVAAPQEGANGEEKAEQQDPNLVEFKVLFIKRVLQSLCRLSYLDKIKSSVPPEYYPYLPPAPGPIFRFPSSTNPQEESKEMVAESHQLLLSFKTKDPLEKIISYISSISPSINQPELLTKCILKNGSISFSHLTYAVERYITLFKTILKNEADRQECIRAIFEFWATSHQHIVIVLDKFITFKIINPLDSILFLLNKENYQQYIFEPFSWEIIHNSILKTIIIIDALSKDIQESSPSQEKDFKLNNAIQEQQQLLSELVSGLGFILSEENQQPLSQTQRAFISGQLKSITRKYFSQMKQVLSNQPTLLAIINQYTLLK
ncbi:hypothetical protein CYY_009519 [Polysphondylium violaceum]|uniref:MIF4G domain-containing protein n=1 Tax=Polysphondylium violaceum TaxID=133409 RepID=A0A8J4PL91_9MYCE|nr:hypothetical protein CYY_009519 [Polysphondylium violaceum]